MARALLFKELRESVPIVAIASLVALYQLATLIGFQVAPWSSTSDIESIPFVTDDLFYSLGLVGGGLAIALGLKQTAWEEGRNTYHFLLHRPIARTSLFSIKMLIGVGLTLFVPGLLILAYAAWASNPNTHPAPFRWSMTLPAWSCWAVLPVVYAGAFASGLRPARWFGSKLAPLAVAILVTFLFAATDHMAWTITTPVVLAVLVGLLIATFSYAVSRDY